MKKIFTLIFILATVNATAQITFQKVIGEFGYEAGNSIIQTNDGGTATVGYTSSFGSGSEVYVVKLDANGNVQWTKTIGGNGSDGGSSIVQTSDGGYAITGYTSSFGSGGNDVFVLKLDIIGNIQWAKTIGGSDNEYGNSIVQTSDGGYAITGNIVYNTTNGDVYVVKLDSNGNLQWTKIIAENSNDTGYSIIQASDGGYAIAGITASFPDDYLYILKLDSSGMIQWTKAIGDTSNDWGTSIIQTSDGGFAVCGRTGSDSQWSYDVYVVKLNSAGNVLWTRTIYGNWTEAGYSIVENSDGSLVVCGYSDSFGGPGTMDFYLVKLDANGNLIWTRSIGTIFNDQGYGIARTNDGGYALCGSVYYFDGTTDMLIIKTDSNGNSCTNGIVGTTSTYGTAVTTGSTDSSGGVIANAFPTSGSGGLDSMLCYSFPNTVEKYERSIIKLFPNPTTGELIVQSSDPDSYLDGKIESIEIYSSLAEKLFSQQQTVNPPKDGSDLPDNKSADGRIRLGGQLTVDVSKLPSGIYFMRVKTDAGISTVKFVKE